MTAVRQFACLAGCNRDQPDVPRHPIRLHVGRGDGVEHARAVGRELRIADARERKEIGRRNRPSGSSGGRRNHETGGDSESFEAHER